MVAPEIGLHIFIWAITEFPPGFLNQETIFFIVSLYVKVFVFRISLSGLINETN